MELKWRFCSVHTLLLLVALTFVLKLSTYNCNEVPNPFPWKFLDAIEPKKSPLLISPASLKDSLEIAYFGSAGDTSTEMRRSLNEFGTKKLIASKLKARSKYSANAIYTSKNLDLASEFRRIVVRNLETKDKVINFSLGEKSSRRIINWIEAKTRTNLKSLDALNHVIDKRTSLVEVNVLKFSAEWEKPFEFEFDVVKNVTMMRRFANFSCGHLEDLNAKAVILPFKNSKANMLLLIPNERENLEILIERIKNYDVDSIESRLIVKQVDVFFPTIELNQGYLLNKALNKMNFKQTLTRNANFTRLIKGRKNYYIQNVLQASSIKINKRKIGLRAATVVQLKSSRKIRKHVSEISKKRSSSTHVEGFYIDNPFIFAIKEGSNILALGGVSKFS